MIEQMYKVTCLQRSNLILYLASKTKENSKKIVSVLNFPTFTFVYKIVVVKNI